MIIESNQGCDLVIFGTKGDLAKRKLFPSLYTLEKNQKIHKNTRIIGVGRANWNIKEYKKFIKEAINNFAKEKIDNKSWDIFSSRLFFCNIDVNDKTSFLQLKYIFNTQKNIIIYYCAMPPNTFSSICQGLGYAQLNAFPARIIIEKPLGVCLQTSQEINNQIARYFKESQIFRIDHYLGKESVLNLLSLRFANMFFSNNWNNQTIDHIQITVSEKIGIENRWNYFDKTGQMRDMVQNHLLQILTIVAMSQPKKLTADNIRSEKVKILRALRRINLNDIHLKTARGQYSSGVINGIKVPSYQNENGASKNTKTETLVAIRADIDNEQWNGVPFYLRTGKRLESKYSEIVIYFKKMPINIFHNSNYPLFQNKLVIRLEPENNIKINIFNKAPGLDQHYKLEEIQLLSNNSKKYHSQYSVDAYERLLLESMRGIQSLFVSRDEIEEAWKWIDSIIESWKKEKNYIPQFYTAGTKGSNILDFIIKRDGRSWNI